MVARARPNLACASAALALLSTAPALARCEDIVPDAPIAPPSQQPLTATDLISLRDVGDPDSASFGSPSPFAVSPDQSRVAYVISRADVASNSYCRALVVSRLDGKGAPLVLDRGGEHMMIADIQRGFYLPSGAPLAIRPVWSPDGRALAYLRRDQGRTRAWVVNAQASTATAVSNTATDVEAVAWSRDGQRLLFGTRHQAAEQEAALDREGESGWLYDRRIAPQLSARPMSPASERLDITAVAPETGQGVIASADDMARLEAANAGSLPADVAAVDDDGARAFLERNASSPLAPARLVVADHTGIQLRCTAPACAGGILALWWHHHSVHFLRREGWDKEMTALYRWTPGHERPRPILRTRDVLHGCVQAHDDLVCTRESSVAPRKVVALSLATGMAHTIFDANPQFATIRLGTVTRLHWRNAFGLEAWGDLVLPPGYRAGTKLPMVVVQYHSDGFLRGGTGDEYPIYLLAQQGIAVLSTERPTFFAAAFPQLKTWYEVNAANQKNWGERRSLLSSVLTGVQLAIDRGVIDPAHVGITGLSDGASTVAFALINSNAFSAAAVSSCCMEPNTTATYGGIAWAEWLRGMGYPPVTRDDPGFWHDMSLARNAHRIGTPLLMQLADDEFRLALEAFGALHEQNKPVEMYVFPDEFHVKWQPVHRLAVYQRTLDWFGFWLQHREDPDPAKAAQYQRWRAMRDHTPPPAEPAPVR